MQSQQLQLLAQESTPDDLWDEVCTLNWIRSPKWPRFPSKSAPKLRFVDLFSGCGGLSLGVLEVARVLRLHPEIALAADNAEAMFSVYRRNFARWLETACCDDIRNVTAGEIGSKLTQRERALRDTCGELDLVVAGPPCQGHSDLNNRTRRHDPRNSLYLHAVRFVEVARPRAVMIENVPTAVHALEKVVDDAETALAQMGYCTESVFSNAGDVGLAQKRKRHFLVAAEPRLGSVAEQLAARRVLPATLDTYIKDIEEEWLERKGLFFQPSRMTAQNRKRVDYLFGNGAHDLPDSERPPCHRNKKHSYRSVYGRLRWDTPAQTLTSGFGSMGQGRYVHPSQRRVITPHEAARIQGFPDFFDFSLTEKRTALHTMIGNAVPPRLGASVILALLTCLQR